MKLLGWDTSSKAGAIVALEWDPSQKSGWNSVKLVSEWSLKVDATHSERLLWAIDSVLESARWKIRDIDVFAVGVGPGSFTGLRIGITTARTLAHSLGKPLVPVSSLAVLARPVAASVSAEVGADPSKVLVMAATDACKGEFFSLWGSASAVRDCVIRAEGDFPGFWKRGVDEAVVEPEEWLERLVQKAFASPPSSTGKKEKSGYSSWVVVGESRLRYPELWKGFPRDREWRPSQPFLDQVQGRYLGQLAWEGIQLGLMRDPLLVYPRYLRASDAELKLRAGLLPKAPV
jgi:tRNA threonylcarbamoyl adenosine modification protein YeaZ